MSDNNTNNALERACNEGNAEKVKALLSAGANANLRVIGGGPCWSRETLLHKTSSVEITRELLLGGADVNARTMYNETPLHCAITRGKKLELVRELLKHGADVNATNRKGYTALNHAVTKMDKNLGIVKVLLEYGADINIRNRDRSQYQDCDTSLDNAVMRSLACAKLLIKHTLIMNFNKDYENILDLSPYKECSSYSILSSYLEDCVCEIIKMKTDEIKDSLPLYDVVTNNFNIHNNKLSARLAKIDYSIHYPIYNDVISEKVKPFLERADLLNKLSKIQFYTKLYMTDQDDKDIFCILDHDSTYNITEYLSNGNLSNFIAAFEGSNKRTFQSGTRLNETSSSNDTKRARLE